MSNPIQASKQDLEREIGLRLAAQDSMALFGEYVYPWWHAYEMHHVIAFYLEQVAQYLTTGQGIQNLMILTPPQHGKSVEVSNVFPAWMLGKLPDLRILMCSYGADLASDNSREVRNIVISDAYQALFGNLSAMNKPVRLATDSRAVTRWDLAAPHRGGLVAAGVQGSFTGRAKGLVVLDDLYKDHRQAESQDYRDDVWDFLRSSIRPRALAKVLIMTHWHPDDCAGRYMRQMILNPKADQWVILMLPGIALDPIEYAHSVEEQRKRMLEGVYVPLRDPLERKPGDVLCPAMLSKAEMLKIKEGSDYYFDALYQQMPYPKEGARYKRDWFKTINQLPEGVTIVYCVRYWDKASSPKGDFTVGVLLGYGSDGLFYILDVARGQWTSYERDAEMLKVGKKDYEKYGGRYQKWHQQDPGSAGLDSAVATNRALRGLPVFFEPVSGSKETRSEPLESAFQGKMVSLLKGGWNDAFIEECCAFNRGKYDDQVDAASSAYSKLLEIIELMEAEVIEDQVVYFEERVDISPV